MFRFRVCLFVVAFVFAFVLRCSCRFRFVLFLTTKNGEKSCVVSRCRCKNRGIRADVNKKVLWWVVWFARASEFSHRRWRAVGGLSVGLKLKCCFTSYGVFIASYFLPILRRFSGLEVWFRMQSTEQCYAGVFALFFAQNCKDLRCLK